MSGLASASTPTSTFSSIQQSKIQSWRYINPCNSVVIPTAHLCSSDLSLKSCSFGGARVPQRSSIICKSSTGPGAPGSGVLPFSFLALNSLWFISVVLNFITVIWPVGFQNYVFWVYFLFGSFPELYAS